MSNLRGKKEINLGWGVRAEIDRWDKGTCTVIGSNLGGGNSCTTLQSTKITELYTYNGWVLQNVKKKRSVRNVVSAKLHEDIMKALRHILLLFLASAWDAAWSDSSGEDKNQQLSRKKEI